MIRRTALSCLLGLAASSVRAALVFNFNPAPGMDANAQQGFQDAADIWSGLLFDDITINIDIDFAALAPDVLGGANSTRGTVSYDVFRAAVENDVRSYVDLAATLALPTGSSFNLLINRTADHPDGPGGAAPYLDNDGSANNSTIRMTTANAKALGLLAGDDPIVDANITFSNLFNWDFDRSNGITAGFYDFVGVALHEIGHVLGFISGVDILDLNGDGSFPANVFTYVSPLDMFRFSAESVAYGYGTIDFTADNREKYLSLTEGASSMGATFSTGVTYGDGRQASHWKDNLGIGLMDPTALAGTQLDLTARDLQAMDIIGYDLSAASAIPEPQSALMVIIGSLALRVFGRPRGAGPSRKAPDAGSASTHARRRKRGFSRHLGY